MIKLLPLLEGIKIGPKDVDTMHVDILDDTNKKIGTIDLEGDGTFWTIIGATIDQQYRNKGYYYRSLLQILDTYPTFTIVSAFRSDEANRAWERLKTKIGREYNIRSKKEDGEIVYYLTKN